MRNKRLILGLIGLGLLSYGCASTSFDSESKLGSIAMKFNLEGAELGECGLVSQFEKGRSTSSQSGGGG